MDCPNCEERLSETNSDGLLTFECNYCECRWIGGAVIQKLLTKEPSSRVSLEIFATIHTQSTPSETKQCPSCESMHLSICQIQNIELDICSKCNGVFFDKGEIQQFLPNTHKPNYKKAANTAFTVEAAFYALVAVLSGF